MNQKANRILWGVVLIALGVILGINALDLMEINLFFKGWWTLFILVPSAIGLLTEKNKWGSLIGLLFGVFFLLCAWDILSYDLLWKLAAPVAAVLVGLSLLFGKRSKKDKQTVPVEDTPLCTAVFSGQEVNYNGQPFHGGEAIAVFGGVDLFATSAVITEDCVVKATAIFGGVDLHLPATVNVVVTSGGLFGGVEDKRKLPPLEGAPTVYVRASFVFGGVDIL
ncbi:MAG: hypothetical protein IKA50_00885 [Clostridia bacterium]|nr:hypothetical protein [Clostridia bacterium]